LRFWRVATAQHKQRICYEMLHRASVQLAAGSGEHGNELSGCVKGGEFLD